jgi:predicted DNA-binding transcriptional regulator AlpA
MTATATATPTQDRKLRDLVADRQGPHLPGRFVDEGMQKYYGVGKTALRWMTQNGRFPRPIRLTPRVKVYVRVEVLAALDRLEKERNL